MTHMLTRRHFIVTSAMALSAAQTGPIAAQTAPLQLDVLPEEVDPNAISLPPTMEGNFAIPERYQAKIVPVQPGLTPNEIHIVSNAYHLYFILPDDLAIRYGVAVGQEGLGWAGQATIQRKVEWPSWTPTQEMIERNPEQYEQYADGMPGGPSNPLGARALYFYQGERDTAIRVHGTTSPRSIGSSASNGCFRMYNSHVINLYNRVPLGVRAFAYIA
ncbi:putative L,D-transpeptidase ErfK/SrfK precursor [Flavimaricola marinus]|uniref:Putative L,D-transpeptidase ErfK/SrfK n=2 Tax=Flavimaricola marinus TaxID=1819565 RepID=A0A238LBF3_9RHOB|nr:putative L,D-transpeptidase ErfK/SrfK precursor [Flavimaricola marinus]